MLVSFSEYGGGAPFAGLHAVVVGAGNSSIDVCQDLTLHGAASVTMRCPSSQASRAVSSCTRAASSVVSRIIIFGDVERMNDLA